VGEIGIDLYWDKSLLKQQTGGLPRAGALGEAT
jgi:hypothetical protein